MFDCLAAVLHNACIEAIQSHISVLQLKRLEIRIFSELNQLFVTLIGKHSNASNVIYSSTESEEN